MAFNLDLKDKKILFELDKDSSLSLQKIAKKVGLSKEVVFHRINHLINEKVILKFHTVPASYRLGLTAYKIYLRLSNISKQEFDELVDYLIKNNDVFWIGTCKGRWDLIFGIWAKSIEDFFIVHDKILDKFSKYIQDKELSISRENLQYNRRWFYYDTLDPLEFNFGEKEEKVKLDEKDQKILQILTDNSRIKITDISEKIKLNPKVIAYRIREMEKKGIIKGYKTLLNSSIIGFCTCKAFIFFKNINEIRKKEFLDYCKKLPNSINIVITFAPWDLEIMFETKTYEEYFKIMDDVKEKFKDIIKLYDSILISSEPKQRFISHQHS
jgi:Lrp/AsnC family transcriptional regulator, leucine-responsive regulatory protein